MSRFPTAGSIDTSAFEMLEPSAGKLACSVLRGAGGGNAPRSTRLRLERQRSRFTTMKDRSGYRVV